MKVHLNKPGSKKEIHHVKIDKFDTWNMDVTLAYIIVPMLKQLKEVKHGAPFVDNEDVSDELRASDEDLHTYSKNGETDEHYFDRWDYVMDEMIFAFESKVYDDWEEQFFSESLDFSPDAIGDFDKKGYNVYSDRINNGFRLFGKYYNGLWD